MERLKAAVVDQAIDPTATEKFDQGKRAGMALQINGIEIMRQVENAEDILNEDNEEGINRES